MPQQKLRFLLLLYGLGALTVQNAAAQAEPEIDKNNISIHPVRRGNMPIRLMPAGEIVSLTPPEVLVTVPTGTVPSPQVGQQASVQIKPPGVMMGSVVDIDRATLLDSWKLTIRLKEPFPAAASLGTKAASLVEVGELKDVVYFERPATARPNTEMALFVMEPGGEFAKRTTVRFGIQSGALIQIVSGLSPGDMVIVTDTTKWNSYQRVRVK
jgi:HlyD family secretion protein